MTSMSFNQGRADFFPSRPCFSAEAERQGIAGLVSRATKSDGCRECRASHLPLGFGDLEKVGHGHVFPLEIHKLLPLALSKGAEKEE